MKIITGIIASSILKTVMGTELCDLYPAAAAYSLRKLRTSYVNVIQLRRSSDDAITEVVGETTGLTLSSLVVAGGTLGDWVGANSAYVRTLIDQSGNAKHLIQYTNSLQPILINAGVLEVKNGLSAINMLSTLTKLELSSGLSALNQGNSFTIYTVSNNRVANTVGTILNTTTLTDAYRFVMLKDSRTTVKRNGFIQTSIGGYGADLNNFRNDTNQVLQVAKSNGSELSAWDNNLVGGQNISFSGTYVNNILRVGAQHLDLTPLDGYIQEIIIRGVADNDTDRIAIRDNINLRYAIF